MNNLPVSSHEELLTYIERQRQNGWADLPVNKRAFAHEYIIHYRHREAAIKSGFSKNYGIQLLRDPLVAAYIEHLQGLQLTNSIITKDFINSQYMRLYDMATGEEEIHHVLPDGTAMKVRKTELGTAHNILDKMSKSTEYAKETGNKNASVNVNIDFGTLLGSNDDSSGFLPPIIDVEVDNE